MEEEQEEKLAEEEEELQEESLQGGKVSEKMGGEQKGVLEYEDMIEKASI